MSPISHSAQRPIVRVRYANGPRGVSLLHQQPARASAILKSIGYPQGQIKTLQIYTAILVVTKTSLKDRINIVVRVHSDKGDHLIKFIYASFDFVFVFLSHLKDVN